MSVSGSSKNVKKAKIVDEEMNESEIDDENDMSFSVAKEKMDEESFSDDIKAKSEEEIMANRSVIFLSKKTPQKIRQALDIFFFLFSENIGQSTLMISSV